MSQHMIVIVLALLVGVVSACQSSQGTAENEQVQQQLAAIETRLDELAQNNDDGGLEARIAALEEKIDTLQPANTDDLAARIEMLEEAAGHQAPMTETGSSEAEMESADHAMPSADENMQNQIFQVTLATYLLDTAGFHALDEQLNEEETIQPSDAGAVRRVQGALAVTDWPTGLEAKADQLLAVLDKFALALSDDDLEAAKPLASEAHEVQHDFSHAVENWLAVAGGAEAGGEMEHAHEEGAAHVDHSDHHGGFVGMSGDLHLEIVSEEPGQYQIFLSDAFRQPLSPEGVTGNLVLMPGTDQEELLPLQVMHGEHLMASGGPTDVEAIDVSIRLDDTPEGHVEMDFTLSYEGEHEHQ